MKMTPGKLAGMKAVADDRGVIAAAAMDQRGSLQKALAKEKGGDVGDQRDRGVQDARHRGADPARERDPARSRVGHSRQQAAARRTPGLLLAYEKTGYDATTEGRLPDLLDDWSVRRLKEAGADCIKILLYYAPSDPAKINNLKHAWVERIGDECRANDIPFFLELIGYEKGVDEKSLAFAQKKPEIVTGSMEEFTKDRYGADVLKVEVPVNMKFVEGTQAVRRREGLLASGGDGRVPAVRGGHDQAVHLPVGRRQQRRVHRDAGARERSGHARSPACCADARPGKTGLPFTASRAATAFRSWLRRSGREEHRERQRPPEGGAAVVRVLRREVGRRTGLEVRPGATAARSAGSGVATPAAFDPTGQRCRFSTPLTGPRQVSPE